VTVIKGEVVVGFDEARLKYAYLRYKLVNGKAKL